MMVDFDGNQTDRYHTKSECHVVGSMYSIGCVHSKVRSLTQTSSLLSVQLELLENLD